MIAHSKVLIIIISHCPFPQSLGLIINLFLFPYPDCLVKLLPVIVIAVDIIIYVFHHDASAWVLLMIINCVGVSIEIIANVLCVIG